MIRVLVVGAGGIGSQLLDLAIPALTAGDMASKIGGVHIHLMDDDRVEVSNLAHQRHEPRMVGRLKVNSSAERLAPFLSSALMLKPISEKLVRVSQLDGFDLVVVAVDRPAARALVHNKSERWLDLRCGGDGMIALDYQDDSNLVEMMTPLEQDPASCQIPGSIKDGNVQMGYVLAAAHGAQWLVQNLRELSNLPFRPTPSRMYSLTFGELEFPEVPELIARGDE